MTQVRIGLIGMGSISHWHVQAIKSLDDFTLIGICDNRRDHVMRLAEKLNTQGYDDYRRVLDLQPDVVVLILPHHLHAPVALDAMQAGINVVVEKPMAIDMMQIRQLLRTADAKTCSLFVTDTAYVNPIFQKARQIVDSQDLGRLIMGDVAHYRDYFTGGRPEWLLDRRLSGGGQFLNVGVHRIAALRTIMGDDYCESKVTASVEYVHPSHQIEAATKALIQYESGQAVCFEEFGYYPMHSSMATNGIRLLFEHGMIHVTETALTHADTCGHIVEQFQMNFDAAVAYRHLYQQVLAMLNDDAHYPQVEHAARDARIALAAYASKHQACTIDLDMPAWQLALTDMPSRI